MKKVKEIVVKQPEIDPVPLEVMADSIKAISEGIRKLRSTRLNDRALVLLIHHACEPAQKYGNKPSQGDIRSVLAGIESLERTYLKAKP